MQLTNGDMLKGHIQELDRGSLVIETSSGAAKLPLSRVESIVLGSPQPLAVSRQPSQGSSIASPQNRERILVGMRDGSLIYAKTIRADENGIELELAGSVKLRGGAVKDLVSLQSLGERVAYLSDLEAAEYRHVPYLTIAWPFTRDRDVLGEPIVVRGKRYTKGIGMHSAARLTYRFDGDFQRFDAAAAIDDSANGRGSVTFARYVLRDDKWVEAYKSDVVRGGDPPQLVSIDLHGARGLTLTVDFADRGDELDHAVWLDARLVR